MNTHRHPSSPLLGPVCARLFALLCAHNDTYGGATSGQVRLDDSADQGFTRSACTIPDGIGVSQIAI